MVTSRKFRSRLTAPALACIVAMPGVAAADPAREAQRDLDALGGVGRYLGWRHAWSPKVRTNLIYARSQYDNSSASTGGGATESVQSIRANVFNSPLPKVDVGAEIMMGDREIESGADGRLTRVQFTTKYSF